MIWPYRIRMVEINGKTNVAESRKNNRGSCKNLPTLFSVDIVNMDTCRNQLLLENIRQYGRKI